MAKPKKEKTELLLSYKADTRQLKHAMKELAKLDSLLNRLQKMKIVIPIEVVSGK